MTWARLDFEQTWVSGAMSRRVTGHGKTEEEYQIKQGNFVIGSFERKEFRDRAVSCVNALAGVPKPEGIPEAIQALFLIATLPVDSAAPENAWSKIEQARALSALCACGIEL